MTTTTAVGLVLDLVASAHGVLDLGGGHQLYGEVVLSRARTSS